MRTMREPNARAMLFTIEECSKINEVAELLGELEMHFGSDNTITSLETGECISPGELRRVRGILDFLTTYRVVELS